jgi:phosphatidylglycerol---prolipoprotein diacylglyceryl transferase
MNLISFIIWSPDPDIFTLFGFLTIRWYGLLFALGFIIGQQIMFYFFKKEGKPEKDVESLTIWMVVATVLGARLGHVLFYEPDRYLPNPIQILKIWEGGLASHGAAIGILIALYLYVNYYVNISLFPPKFEWKKRKRENQSYLWTVDRIVIIVALAGALIRTGNFMNSEIIGEPTEGNFGVLFARNAEARILHSNPAIHNVSFERSNKPISEDPKYHPIAINIHFKDRNFTEREIRNFLESEVKFILVTYRGVTENFYEPREEPLLYDLKVSDRGSYVATVYTLGIPRHPAQLYEAISTFLLFLLLFWLWNRKKEKTTEGRIFGLFLVILFSLRFFYEFLKEPQVDFEEQMTLYMGQWLSIPFVLVGIYLLVRSANKKSGSGDKIR